VPFTSPPCPVLPHRALYFLTVPCTSPPCPVLPHRALYFPTVPFTSPPFPTLLHRVLYFPTVPCTSSPCPGVPHGALYVLTVFCTSLPSPMYILTVPCTSSPCFVLSKFLGVLPFANQRKNLLLLLLPEECKVNKPYTYPLSALYFPTVSYTSLLCPVLLHLALSFLMVPYFHIGP